MNGLNLCPGETITNVIYYYAIFYILLRNLWFYLFWAYFYSLVDFVVMDYVRASGMSHQAWFYVLELLGFCYFVVVFSHLLVISITERSTTVEQYFCVWFNKIEVNCAHGWSWRHENYFILLSIKIFFYHINCQVIEVIIEAGAMGNLNKAKWSAIIVEKLLFQVLKNARG